MSGPRVAAFERTIVTGGVVLFGSDTVYGLACDPSDASAIERLYALKGRPPDKSAAVMFFDLDAALATLPELGPDTATLLRELMPGPVTALLPNPRARFPLACRADGSTLGIRVVSVPTLAGARVAVLQSSANPSGDAEPRTLAEVAPALKAGADLVIDGGELPGVASTVLDLRHYEDAREWSIVRPGPVGAAEIAAAERGRYRFTPERYGDDVIREVHDYDALQDGLVAAAVSMAIVPRRILELGTGTGETTRRLLDAFAEATVVGIDGSRAMLAAAVEMLPADRFSGVVADLAGRLPEGPFDLVASALTVHHLAGDAKAELFGRVRSVLRDGGRFVLADVVVPGDPGLASIELTAGFDSPSGVGEQLDWLLAADFADVRVAWATGDLAVIVADAAGRLE